MVVKQKARITIELYLFERDVIPDGGQALISLEKIKDLFERDVIPDGGQAHSSRITP